MFQTSRHMCHPLPRICSATSRYKFADFTVYVWEALRMRYKKYLMPWNKYTIQSSVANAGHPALGCKQRAGGKLKRPANFRYNRVVAGPCLRQRLLFWRLKILG